MSVRDKLFHQFAAKSRLITAVISLACLYYLSVLPLIGDRVNVNEDTMATGRTPPFIEAEDIFGRIDVDIPETIASLGLPTFAFQVSTGETIHYTVVESKRGDSREGVVFAITVSDMGTAVAITVAKALLKAQWLARDIYFVFVPLAVGPFGYGLREWVKDFYFPSSDFTLMREKPLIRAAFALNLSGGGSLLMDYEGINGILSEQDVSNLMFEVADELRVPLKIRPVYESIAYMAFNGGVHAPHSVFIDSAIPAISLRHESTDPRGSGSPSVGHTAQLVGKYLRALSSLHHQLHHSTSVFFYSTYRYDVSQGKIVPLMVGLVSPWFVTILVPEANNAPVRPSVAINALTYSAFFLVGGLIFLSLIGDVGTSSSNQCQNIISPDWRFSWKTVGTLVATSGIHAWVSRRMSTIWSIDYAAELKFTAFKIFSIIMTMLIVFHWSVSVLTVVIIFLPLFAATPLRGPSSLPMKAASLTLFLVSVLVFYLMVTGASLPAPVQSFVSLSLSSLIDWLKPHASRTHLLIDLLTFFRALVDGSKSYNKSISTLIQEFVCVQGLALVVIWIVMFPALLIVFEILVSPVPVTQSKASNSPTGNKRQKLLAVCVAGLAYIVYEYMR